MRFYSNFYILIIAGLSVFTISAAQTKKPSKEVILNSIYLFTEEQNKPDPLIQNGIYYSNPYYNATGHPFLGDGNLKDATIVFRKKEYSGVKVNYDLFHQQIIVGWQHDNSMQLNLIPNEFISEFRLNNMLFRRISFNDNKAEFYQVVAEEDSIACYYTYHKIRNEANTAGAFRTYVFSEERSVAYLLTNGELERYRNSRSFVNILPDRIKNEVRNYLRTNKIKLNKADVKTTEEVVKFCQTVLSNNQNS